jgi:hypothetical protein
MLDRADNAALSQWQRRTLRVAWAIVREPWRFEEQVIRAMGPPMNRERIAALSLHREVDGHLEHAVELGVWWRPLGARPTAGRG